MTYQEAIEVDDLDQEEAISELEKHGCTWEEFNSENPSWDGSGEDLLTWLGY